MLLFTSYISFNYPRLLHTFMAQIFYISEMDVTNSGLIIDSFEFETGNRQFNNNFGLFGVYTTQFLTNTGPTLALAVIATAHYLVSALILVLTKKCYKYKFCR